MVNNWGSSNSGYWGSASNSIIEQEILDLIQLEAVDVGTNIAPVLSNGTKASEAGYLDERASQDTNTTDNTVSAYLASTHNGRRMISTSRRGSTDHHQHQRDRLRPIPAYGEWSGDQQLLHPYHQRQRPFLRHLRGSL